MTLAEIDTALVQGLLPCFVVGIERSWQEGQMDPAAGYPDWMHCLIHQAGGYSCASFHLLGAVYPLRFASDSAVAKRLLPLMGSAAAWSAFSRPANDGKGRRRKNVKDVQPSGSAYGEELEPLNLRGLMSALDPSAKMLPADLHMEACLRFRWEAAFEFLCGWPLAKIIHSSEREPELQMDAQRSLDEADFWQVLAFDPKCRGARSLEVWLLWENRD